MNKVYYNQADSRWASHPYTCNVPGYTNTTIKSSGCGVTCGAMVISSCREIITPDKMGDLAMANGFRVPGGTADAFFSFICKKWGLEIEQIHSSYEAFDRCKKGWFVVMCAGPGLWTTGGHFILAVGAREDEIQIFDSYLYAGKYDTASRKGAGVKVEGNSCFVRIDKFREYSNIQRLYAIKVGDVQLDEPIDVTQGRIRYVIDETGLNVREGRGTDYNIVRTLEYGTQVLEYDSVDGWSRIGSGMYVYSKYLSEENPIKPEPENNTQPVEMKQGTVKSDDGELNVRGGIGTEYPILRVLTNGDLVTIYEEKDGWYRIDVDNQWVSSKYVIVDEEKPVTKFMYVKVDGSLNVRKGGGTKYEIVGSLTNGMRVVVLDEKDGWAQIGDNEWVSMKYLVANEQETVPSTVGKSKYLAGRTMLYENPDLTGKSYAYLANTLVTILQNVNLSVDKIYVPKTGRTAYCSNKSYK